MTVSRVLRGIGSVKPATRKKVMEVADALGGGQRSRVLFHKHVGGGKASGHRLRLLLPEFLEDKPVAANELRERFIHFLEAELEQNGGSLIRRSWSSGAELFDHVSAGRFHGVVILNSLPSKWFRRLTKITNVVSAVANDFIPGCDCVFLNESRAATEIYNRLSKLGHTRVTWFGINDTNFNKPLENVDSLRDRLGQVHVVRYAAWNSIAHLGPTAEYHKTLYLTRDHDRQSIEDIVELGITQMFNGANGPTAIVTPTEIVAVTLIDLLRKRGIGVPRDCSVVSYGRTSVSVRHRPTIAGIRTGFEDLARAVPELIIRRLATPDARPITVSLEADFEVGTSLGSMRA